MEQKRPTLGEFIILNTLGSGTSSKVKLAYHPQTLATYAIKILKPTYAIQRITDLEREITILSALKHPNIVNLVQVYESIDYTKKNGTSSSVTALVFDFVPGGDLFEYIMSSGRFSEDIARTHFRTLIETLEFCHDQGVTHRDLKPENLLFDADFTLKIADFGYATLLCGRDDDGRLLTYIGSEACMAPEILAKQPYNGSAIDVFACGIILFVMVIGNPPFDKASNNDRTYRHIVNNQQETFWARYENNKSFMARQSSVFTTDFKNLVNGMLAADPAVRLTIAEIKAHPWYNAAYKPMSEIQEEFTQRKVKIDERIKKEKQRKEDIKKMASQQQNSRMPFGIYQGIKPFRSSENLNIEHQIGPKVDFDAKRTIEEHSSRMGFKPFSEIFSVVSPNELLKIVCYGCQSILNEYTVSDTQFKVKGKAFRDEGRCGLKVEITKMDDGACCIEFHRDGNNSWIFYQIVDDIKKKILEFIQDDENGTNDKEGGKKVSE